LSLGGNILKEEAFNSMHKVELPNKVIDFSENIELLNKNITRSS